MAPPFTWSPTFTLTRGRRIEQHIDTRSELDQADALAALQAVSNLGIENDAPRQQPGDLLEHHGLPVAFDGNDILLVQFGGSRTFIAFRYLPRW